jgi:lipopolysaccharide transport system ATP-binding protein
MKVRLAFAVAAHLEPDILIVDEVLAVGDAEFQKKAIGKMQDISSGEGRTVLFVSHNMASIQALCSRCIVIEKGSIVFDNEPSSSIEFYYKYTKESSAKVSLRNRVRNNWYGQELKITSLIVNKDNSLNNTNLVTGGKAYFKITAETNLNFNLNKLSFTVSVFNSSGSFLFSSKSDCIDKLYDMNQSEKTFITYIRKLPLNKGEYSINVNCSSNDRMLDSIHEAVYFNVKEGDFYGTGRLPAKRRNGVYIDFEWL